MIDESVVQRVLGAALRTGGEFAEVYAEDKRSSSAALDDGKVEEVTSGRDRGAGVRVVAGETTGYAHTADLSEEGLLLAAEAASAAARAGGGGARVVDLSRRSLRSVSPVAVYPETVEKATKVELLLRADAAARAAGSAVVQVSAGYGDSRKRILVANSDGLLAEDDQVRTLFRVSVVAQGDAGMQTGYESLGHTVGFELFDDHDVEAMAQRAAQRALTKLGARPAPSGSLPVVIKAGSGGVLFHEACGHGLEADLVAKGASVFRGRVGEQVASPLVTLVDDGTMTAEWGAITIDDEGHPAQRNTLIQDGVLTDYMWDYLRARKEGRPQSGNGRRQSYQHLPMVRMTNTYVLNGTEDPDDIIRATDHGVYVALLGGGQVNTATGDFVFGMTEAYMIEGGELGEPIREGNLIGNGPQVLRDIDLLGNDFAMGMPGTCGKDGQGVPVGDGQPTLRVKALTIGGDRGMTADGWESELLPIAERVAAQARAGEQVEAYVGRSFDTSVRVYEGEIEQLQSAQSEGIGIRVIRDGRVGFAYGGVLDEASVAEVLEEARDNSDFGTPDEWAGLAEPDGVAVPDLQLWSDELAGYGTDDKVALALELERLTLARDPRVRVEQSEYSDSMGEAAVATSTGIRAAGRECGCYVVVSTLASEGDETQTGFAFSVGRTPAELDLAKAAGDGARRATRLLGATKPGSRRVTVVLDPYVTAQLLSVLSATVNGEAVLKGRSLFANRLGEEVASPVVTLVDDPTNPLAFSASPVDGEGLATRRTSLVEGGVLRGFLQSSYSGRRSGTASTANAVRGFKSTPSCGAIALQLAPGTRSQAEIVAGIDDGVLIDHVAGIHSGVNPVSGDFSTGASGLLISGGALGAPVREFTIASTLQKMLKDVAEVGGDVDWLPMRAAGVSLVIHDVTMSGA